jgi:hypothetical protein
LTVVGFVARHHARGTVPTSPTGSPSASSSSPARTPSATEAEAAITIGPEPFSYDAAAALAATLSRAVILPAAAVLRAAAPTADLADVTGPIDRSKEAAVVRYWEAAGAVDDLRQWFDAHDEIGLPHTDADAVSTTNGLPWIVLTYGNAPAKDAYVTLHVTLEPSTEGHVGIAVTTYVHWRHGPQSKVAAQSLADSLAASMTAPDAAVPDPVPPSRGLAGGQPLNGDGFAYAARFWQVDGTLGQMSAWYFLHPPLGLAPAGGGSGSGSDGSESLSLDFADSGNITGDLTVVIVMERLDASHVGISAQLRVRWVLPRPAAEHLGHVTSVRITSPAADGKAARTVRVTGAKAASLAALFNGRAPDQREGSNSCPTAPVRLVFADADGTVSAVVTCDRMTVARNGKKLPPLQADGEFTSALDALLSR